MAERARFRTTAGDMLRSLVVVLAVVAVILILNARDESPTVRSTGYTGALRVARDAASYDVLGPVGLSSGWRANSARAPREDVGVTLHIGFVTPEGEYAGLEQGGGASKRFVDRFVDGSRADGDVTIGGRTWQRREGGDPEPRGLVARIGSSTVVVAGTAGWDELEELAGSLQAG